MVGAKHKEVIRKCTGLLQTEVQACSFTVSCYGC